MFIGTIIGYHYFKAKTMKLINIKTTGSNIWFILKKTISEFIDDNALKLSAALSYYTIFSLPPLLLIIVSLCGIFFGEDAVQGKVFYEINSLVGNVAALQIQDIMKNMKLYENNTFAIWIGIIFLTIGASGVFSEIQDSINYIWGLKAKPKKGLVKFIKNRLLSFSMIGVMSFLLLVSLMVSAIMDILSKNLASLYPHITVTLFFILNHAIVFITISILFMVVYKTLPDGKVAFKDSAIGACVTALFFMIGKFAIGAYLGNSAIGSTYGTAGSVIIILAWVYYSAIILYFGAEFTKVYALTFGKKIIPKEYSVQISKECIEIETKVPLRKIKLKKVSVKDD